MNFRELRICLSYAHLIVDDIISIMTTQLSDFDSVYLSLEIIDHCCEIANMFSKEKNI